MHNDPVHVPADIAGVAVEDLFVQVDPGASVPVPVERAPGVLPGAVSAYVPVPAVVIKNHGNGRLVLIDHATPPREAVFDRPLCKPCIVF